jgi:transcriptional regulator with XRE-family HTH domain
MTISENLRTLRAAAQMSQTHVANMLNITRQAYNHYETGIRIPPLDMMEKLCAVYGIDMNILTGFSPQTNAAENLQTQTVRLTFKQEELLKIFSALNPENQIKVMGYADGLYKDQEGGDRQQVLGM